MTSSTDALWKQNVLDQRCQGRVSDWVQHFELAAGASACMCSELSFTIRCDVTGGANWAHLASLVETCKLNGVNPQVYLSGLLTRLVNGWPQAHIDGLMPWCWAAPKEG